MFVSRLKRRLGSLVRRKRLPGGLLTEQGMMLALGLLLFAGVAVAGARVGQLRKTVDVKNPASVAQIPEIQVIVTSPDSPRTQSEQYLKLIKRIGPIDAQEALLRSGLPFNGNSHLINHTVGDYLYEKYGNQGLVHCRDYFLSSCYHGFTLHIVAGEKDEIFKNVQEVIDYCGKKGRALVVQCTHAIGHGVLAYKGYANLLDALTLCDQLQEATPTMPAIDCHDGVFMENIFAVHNGSPSPDRWIKSDDLQYPCNDSRIADTYKEACWRNQLAHMWPLIGQSTTVASGQCMGLENVKYRETCMHSLARAIQLDSRDDTDYIIRNCRLVESFWQTYCLQIAGNTAFAFGDRDSIFKICPVMEAPRDREACHNFAYEMLSSLPNRQEQLDICNQLEEAARSNCVSRINNPPKGM